MADMPIGDLIRLYRIDRKFSTTYVATHVGITKRYLEMIEANTKTPSILVLRDIAKILGVRTSALMGELPSEAHEGPINPGVAAIERALITFNSFALTDRGEPPGLEELLGRVAAAWDLWEASPSKYTGILEVLPGLIVDVERCVQVQGRSREACRAAYEVYRLARGVLKLLGRVDLSRLVADRAMRYAEESEDRLLIAAATWNIAQTLVSDDMPNAGLEVATQGAEQMQSLLPDGGPEHFSLYGGLILSAVVASVRAGDPWRARDLLRGPARMAAERVGAGRNDYHLVFGPANVALHAVTVEHDTGEFGDALRLADEVDMSALGNIERKTTHLFQVARCYDAANDDPAVFVHLQKASTICPEEFLHRPLVRNMVSTLVRRARPSYADEVRQFASEIGLPA